MGEKEQIPAGIGKMYFTTADDKNLEHLQAAEPIMIDTTDAGIFAGNEKGRKDLYLAVGAFAFAQVIKDMEG